MKAQTLILIGSLALLLAGCGGSGGSDTPAPAPAATDAVPASASQSSAGMNAWLKALSTDLTDVKEPLSVASFAPPSSEDLEPEALN